MLTVQEPPELPTFRPKIGVRKGNFFLSRLPKEEGEGEKKKLPFFFSDA